MEERQLLRLLRIEVDGLFGIYDHRINLNLNDRVKLLHGRNGVGKTTVLRMINAFLRGDIAYFGRIPFTRFLLTFQDDSSLGLTPTDSNTEKDMATVTLTTGDGEKKLDNVELWSGESVIGRRGLVTSNPMVASRMPGSTPGTERCSQKGKFFPGIADQCVNTPIRRQIPWLGEFLQNVNSHLIEAQRLVRTPFDATSRGDFAPRYRRRIYPHSILTSSVVECSRDFKNRLDDVMATYGRQAQTLDQTFPQRLMTASDEIPVSDIQTRMERLTEKTENYKTIGILDETAAHPFDISSLGTLDDTRTSAIALYVHDTELKLKVLDDLANRTRHLLDNVNQKFRHKRLRLDREEGLIAQGRQEQNLPLHSLSSGEQHELVLHYDLLFKTRPNTIVLIDEPEISLHVAWQKNFLPDLMEIVQISGFDAVVATHSPYIVSDRDDLMVGLGDPV